MGYQNKSRQTMEKQYFVARIRSTSSGGEIEASTMRIFSTLTEAEKYNQELGTSVPIHNTGFFLTPPTMFCELYPDMKPVGLNNMAKVRIG